MKKTITSFAIAIITLCSTQLISAQEFAQGTNVINAGIGIGGNFYDGDFGASTPSLGLNLSYERGIWETGDFGIVSLGGYLGYKRYSDTFLGDSFNYSYTIIGVRGAFHYIGLDVENLDVYGGAMVSYNIATFDREFGALSSRPSATVFAGGRYYFTENFGAFAELGYGVAILSLGVAFRF